MDVYLHIGMFIRRTHVAWWLPFLNRSMDLYLQFGYGMMEHCRALIEQWQGSTAILSPRDLTPEQMGRLGKSLRQLPGGAVLLDPQIYIPRADHERLRSHAFWPQDYETGVFWQGPPLTRLLEQLFVTNDAIGTRAVILPGLLAPVIDDDWLTIQDQVLAEGRATGAGRPLFVTIALSADALKHPDGVTQLIDHTMRWEADGYYIVAEHPNGRYLVDDPNWLANLIDLAAALRMQGREVILGYCNQQMLIAGCAKVTAIASGTWMNVRSFPPDKFRTAYDEEIKQRAIWYYSPGALSEYKVPFLDIAHRQGVVSDLAPPAAMGSQHADRLFAGALPSSTGFTEQAAFRHFLHCLRAQATAAVADSFDETVERHDTLLNNGEDVLRTMSSVGVRGQLRDFAEIIDVNRAALELFKRTRGPTIRRAWARL